MRALTFMLAIGTVSAGSGAASVDAAARTHTITPTILHTFQCKPDGQSPRGGVILSGNYLGDTNQGGEYNYGSIFKIDPTTGEESILVNITTQAGYEPNGGLIYAKGGLIGTSYGGGVKGNVFFVDLHSDTATTIYNFQGNPDGAQPEGQLVLYKGNLYGTTSEGGKSNAGTVFELTPPTDGASSWTETVLYSFSIGSDGRTPSGQIVFYHGAIYGTTIVGGGTGCSQQGCGTIFKLIPPTDGGNTWSETIVKAFGGGADGASAGGELLLHNGSVYGTTYLGGGTGCGGNGCGVIFKLNPTTDTTTIVHSFQGADGASPENGLQAVDGRLFGTTVKGGDTDNGTLFEINLKSGKERVIYSFPAGPFGTPFPSGLTYQSGTLYGTTADGGAQGCGTAYDLTP